jgi:hypothetical protein
MCLHNVMIDRDVPQEIRPLLQTRTIRMQHRPHIDNSSAPSELLTGHDTDSSQDTDDMTKLRREITAQMKDIGMKRPQVAAERRRAQDQYDAKGS